VKVLEIETSFQGVAVDWSYIPSISELEEFQSSTYDYRPYYTAYLPYPVGFYPFRFEKTDYLVHDTNVVDEIIDLYDENGFETAAVLQDPFGHEGPTVACPIGFPSGLPKLYRELKRFNRWICRIHVDICYLSADGKLVSVPHVEPDPRFHPFTHIWDTYIHGNVVRGKPAVSVLKWLLGLSR
jgi:hypothetical protein